MSRHRTFEESRGWELNRLRNVVLNSNVNHEVMDSYDEYKQLGGGDSSTLDAKYNAARNRVRPSYGEASRRREEYHNPEHSSRRGDYMAPGHHNDNRGATFNGPYFNGHNNYGDMSLDTLTASDETTAPVAQSTDVTAGEEGWNLGARAVDCIKFVLKTICDLIYGLFTHARPMEVARAVSLESTATAGANVVGGAMSWLGRGGA